MKRGFAIPAILTVILVGLLGIGLFLIPFIGLSALVGKKMNQDVGLSGSSINCSDVENVSAELLGYVADAANLYLKGDQAALVALIQIESSWNPKAENNESSARGLGQFIDRTARGYKEFVGGDDDPRDDWPGPSKTWPAGKIYDNPSYNEHPDDARFDPKRSIYAAGHLLGGHLKDYPGSVGDAYEFGYHGGSTAEQKAEAKEGRGRLMEAYAELLNGGGCKEAEIIAGNEGVPTAPGKVPYYSQHDRRWGSQSYGCGNTTISSSGCGVTSAAMILRYYGKNVTPAEIASQSLSAGYRVCNAGTSHAFFGYIAKKYDLKGGHKLSWERAMTLLKQGTPLIMSGKGKLPFSKGGHYIVVTGFGPNNTLLVNDPAGGGTRRPMVATYLMSTVQAGYAQGGYLGAIYP